MPRFLVYALIAIVLGFTAVGFVNAQGSTKSGRSRRRAGGTVHHVAIARVITRDHTSSERKLSGDGSGDARGATESRRFGWDSVFGSLKQPRHAESSQSRGLCGTRTSVGYSSVSDRRIDASCSGRLARSSDSLAA